MVELRPPFPDDVPLPEELEDECEEWIDCRKCRLAKTSKRVVYGAGRYDHPLIILGLSPGADEDSEGKPFIGVSGRLLRKMFRQHGVALYDFFVINTVGCRPPRNRTPAPSEVNLCRPRFDAAIEILEPKVVLCLGNIAMAAITGRVGIEKQRGRVMKGYYFDREGTLQEVPAVATRHPAALVRTHSKKQLDEMRDDLKIALDMAIEQ